MFTPYTVEGKKAIFAQPSSMTCWAAVYTMMATWRHGRKYGTVREAIRELGNPWIGIFDGNTGLPGYRARNFTSLTHLRMEPRMNYTTEGWSELLQRSGLLWVSHANLSNGNAFLHDRILEGIQGDGTPNGTQMKIMDPDGGRRYSQSYMEFMTGHERQADSDLFGPNAFYSDYQVLHY